MDERRPQIRHEPASRRFVAEVDGHAAKLQYELTPAPPADRAGSGRGSLVITHTLVPEAIGGRGIAGALVEAALAYARGGGLTVVPRCSYAAGFLSRHPEYADLLPGGG